VDTPPETRTAVPRVGRTVPVLFMGRLCSVASQITLPPAIIGKLLGEGDDGSTGFGDLLAISR
jgi:hypothetical protein